MSVADRWTSSALRHQGALGILGAGVVALYLAYGRILAVSLLPVFARTASTLALAGVAVGSVVAALRRSRSDDGALDGRLAGWLAAFAFAAPFCGLMVVEHVPVDQTLSAHGLLTLGIASLVLAVPFALAGVAGCTTLVAYAPVGHRVWGVTLAGAAGGALLAVAGLHLLPATVVPLLVGGTACWAALLLAADAGVSMRGPLVVAVLLVLLGVLAVTQDVFRLRHVKGWDAPYAEDVAWNATSRIGVFPPGPGTTAARTLPLARGAGGYADARVPGFKWIDVDGASWSPMLRFDGDLARLAFLGDSVVYAAHRLRRDARVLVVGVGGGRDLLAARAAGQREVLGVEANPLVSRLVEERFAYYSGRPYSLAGVRVLAGAPRSVLPRLTDRFDVVQLGTSASGTLPPFLENESYLYTREAFREYFRHLTPTGVLSVTRYFTPQHPFEVLRVLATVREAWAAEGAADPSRSVAVLLQELSATLLAQREPFAPAQLDAIDQLARETGMTVLYDPRRATAGTDDLTVLVGTAAPDLAAKGYDFRAATDDWPFFFHFFGSSTMAVAPDPFGLLPRARDAVAMESLLAVAGVVLVVGCLLAGLAASGPSGERPPAALLVYFLCTGYGAVALAVPLLERLALALGSQVSALIVGACGLGLAAAAGSAASARVGGRRGRSALGASLVLAAVALLLALVLPGAVGVLSGAPHAFSTGLAIAGVVPLGLLLGTALPLGVAAARDGDAGSLGASVALHAAGAATAVAVVVAMAMRVGLSGTVASGAAAYAVAAAAMAMVRSRTAPQLDVVPSAAVGE